MAAFHGDLSQYFHPEAKRTFEASLSDFDASMSASDEEDVEVETPALRREAIPDAMTLKDKPLHKMTGPELDAYFKNKTNTELQMDLEEHLAEDVRLNSSFKEELAAEKRTKHELLLEICRLQEELVYTEQERQRDIFEKAQDIQLEEGIWRKIVKKIRTFSPNEDEVQQAVYEWMEEVRSCMKEMQSEIDEAWEVIKVQRFKFASAMNERDKLKLSLQNLNDEIKYLERTIALKKQRRKYLRWENQMLEKKDLETRTPSRSLSSTSYYDARSTPGSMMESTKSTSEFVPRPRVRQPKHFSLQPTFLDDSPEVFVLGSPYPEVTHFDDTNSMSIHTTPRSAISPYSVTPPSPFDIPIPLMESYGERGAVVGAPGTITMPGPLSKFAPKIATVSPPNQSNVTNRFEIGKSFNLHTVCQTSTPYHQVTRVASSIPESGYSGEMINYPLSITHSAEITSPQYETPFVSRSRFGYTDPTAGVLNIPPDLVIPAPLQEPGSSPDVETYGTPPAVTPTTTRRHGLFTPKGIFRKKHYNIRRLFDPEDYESPLIPWSPQYLPDKARSPIRSLSDSPLYSDKSFSWKKHSGSPSDRRILNRTFGASPIMDRTFDATTTHAMDRTFDATIPRAINKTFDTSSPEVYYGMQDASSPYTINRTFDTSLQYNLSRTFDAQPEYNPNRTFDASSAAQLNRTFDASPSLLQNRTFDASPSLLLNRTFDASPPLLQNRTFEARQHNILDRTFDASPHVMNRTFKTSPAVQSMNRTFDDTLESLFHVPYRRQIHTIGTPNLKKSFAPDKTFDKSRAPVLDETYDENRSHHDS